MFGHELPLGVIEEKPNLPAVIHGFILHAQGALRRVSRIGEASPSQPDHIFGDVGGPLADERPNRCQLPRRHVVNKAGQSG